MLAAELGKRIRTIRRNLRLTQREFAAQLKISSSTVSSYELGDSLPSIEILVKLSEIGKCSSDWLLAGCYMALEPGGKIVQLTKEEIELLKLYRDASPENRDTIKRVAELAHQQNTAKER